MPAVLIVKLFDKYTADPCDHVPVPFKVIGDVPEVVALTVKLPLIVVEEELIVVAPLNVKLPVVTLNAPVIVVILVVRVPVQIKLLNRVCVPVNTMLFQVILLRFNEVDTNIFNVLPVVVTVPPADLVNDPVLYQTLLLTVIVPTVLIVRLFCIVIG